MRVAVLFLACLSAIVAGPRHVQAQQRIVGGEMAAINPNQYPFAALFEFDPTLLGPWMQACGGSILNTRSILSAASCFHNTLLIQWRIRVGSFIANLNGTVHNITFVINHPNYIPSIGDSDIAIVRSATPITYVSGYVQPASIAGPNYNVADNSVVWAIGWGLINVGGSIGDSLHMWSTLYHVQVWIVNQVTCAHRYAELNMPITDEMLCSGFLDVGGRGQCNFDTGAPLLHNNVVVGVTSFGAACGHPRYPWISTRVSRFAAWIQSNS